MKLPPVAWAALAVLVVVALVATALGTTSCAPAVTADSVAATVNDADVLEADVTDDVMGMREARGMQDDEAWKGWLEAVGETPETCREQALETRIQYEVVRQAAEEMGVRVTDDDVKDRLDEEYAASSELVWRQMLENLQMTEGMYRERTEVVMLAEKLRDIVEHDDTLQVEEGEDPYAVWIWDRYDSSDIKRNPMPPGLPYDVK